MIYFGYEHINIPGNILNEADTPVGTGGSLDGFVQMLNNPETRTQYLELLQSGLAEDDNQDKDTAETENTGIPEEIIQAVANLKASAEKFEQDIQSVVTGMSADTANKSNIPEHTSDKPESNRTEQQFGNNTNNGATSNDKPDETSGTENNADVPADSDKPGTSSKPEATQTSDSDKETQTDTSTNTTRQE